MITIYWGVNTHYSPEGIRAEAPIPILQKISHERIPKDSGLGQQYNRCPAFTDELTNLYGIKSYYDYTLQFGENAVSSPDHGQEFFDKHFVIRSLEGNLFGFHENFHFFTEEPSLEMSLLPPYFEDNSIANNTITIPGKVDIGKYFRAMSYAFLLKQNCDEIRFNRKEIMMYFKFHTTEKIKFKRFLFTKELNMNDALMMSAKDFKYDIATKLKYYYNIFEKSNLKKKQLKLIKENLCKDE